MAASLGGPPPGSRRFVAARGGPCELHTWLHEFQAEDGLAMLRDISTEMNWPPLIFTQVDGYQFAVPVPVPVAVDGDELER
ncbi:hypothetical protein [Streptomyces venezuelae]|uniref:hypothetical protein n=1 Tax=Streptomyces venezuelae TaxID=54571 RepID=UPI00379ED174